MIRIDPAAALFAGVLLLDLLVAIAFVVRHLGGRAQPRLRARARWILQTAMQGGRLPGRDARFFRRRRWLLLRECARMVDTVDLDGEQRAAVARLLERGRLHIALLRDLHSRQRYRRLRAAAYLPLVASRPVRASLIRALEVEPSRAVRLALAAGLAAIPEPAAIPSLIDTLAGAPLRYQQAIWGLLAGFEDDLATILPVLAVRPEKEIQRLVIHLASRYPSPELRDYLGGQVDSPDLELAREAFRSLAGAYPGSIDHERYLAHDDFLVRNLAAESLGKLPTMRSLALLFAHLDDPLIKKSAVLALTAIARARPQHVRTLMMRALNEKRPTAHAAIVEVLSGYVDYLMEKLLGGDATLAQQVLFEIARHGHVSNVTNFLNQNANPRIEQRALGVLARLIRANPRIASRLSAQLAPRLLAPLGLKAEQAAETRPERRERPRLALLYTFLVLGTALAPAVCVVLALFAPGSLPSGGGPLAQTLGGRILSAFNVLFAFYAGSLNLVYLLLLVFSFIGVRRQASLGSLLRLSTLFKENMLPSISIVSPAFNEEASIVESVCALLTLRYPDFEVIVVNDGSKDGTLQRLVEYFELERTDVFIHRYLNTQEIRGVYANRRYPELLVIDKANGGKADSLNAGINVARKEYFAGIDADSLLERDALLNLAGLFLFEEEEVVAAGGNILPVNGCTVRKGALMRTRIPERPLARFQTVEYLRAFMAGRVGWATIRSLLIISGAFGVFRRRRVIDAHGYLTRAEHYMKDTVGEDMELVVRLTRELREKRVPFSVQYAYNANCWTEIPERFRVLNRQRDRWQRGLLDIVTFHFRVMANPVYGRMGVIGFPYFLLYEILGPWLEAEGTLALIASIVLGSIGVPMLLLVLTATILLGLMVSTASLILAEYRNRSFPLRDKLLLLLYALLENFGFRQLMSLLRVRGFLRMLARVGGWGQMERRGLGAASRQT